MDFTEASGHCGTSPRTNTTVRLLEVIKLATWKPTKYNIVLDSIKKLVRPQASRLMIRGIDQLLMIYICVSSGT